MKKSLLCIFTVLLATNLSARMNPFEPTDTFFEKQDEYVKKVEQEKQIQMQAELKRKKELELVAEQEAQKQAEILKQQLQIEKEKRLQEQKTATQMIKVVEPKVEHKIIVKKDTYQILPFVKIQISQEGLEVYIDKRYKLVNQDILVDQKKFLFDFRGTESFYTVRKILKESKDFKSFAVGTHMEKNFFRVVIELRDNVSKYKEFVDNKNSFIKIVKIK